MNRDEKQRLAWLEEQAAKGFGSEAGAGDGTRLPRPRPSEIIKAIERDLSAISGGLYERNERELFNSYGWSDEHLDDQKARARLLRQRIDQSDLEGWQAVGDRLDWIKAQGGSMDGWDTYPGPSPTKWKGRRNWGVGEGGS